MRATRFRLTSSASRPTSRPRASRIPRRDSPASASTLPRSTNALPDARPRKWRSASDCPAPTRSATVSRPSSIKYSPTPRESVMALLVNALIEWPRSVARHLAWLGPLFARIVTGWVFMGTGWGKLTHLPQVVENFTNWGIPAPQVFGPFVSGVEFFGGIFLLVGFLTRISAGVLGVVMIVAI